MATVSRQSVATVRRQSVATTMNGRRLVIGYPPRLGWPRGSLSAQKTERESHAPHSQGEQPMPYANVMPEGLREMILHLVRNDDEVKQAILDLIRREGEKHRRG